MLSLPPLRLGDRTTCLPLSPLGSIDLANLWLSAGAGEWHKKWERLLVLEPALALWTTLVGKFGRSPINGDFAASGVDHHPREPFVLDLATLAVACSNCLLPAFQAAGELLTIGSDTAAICHGFDAAAWSDGLWAVRAARRALRADLAGLAGESWIAEWLGDAGEWLERAQSAVAERDSTHSSESTDSDPAQPTNSADPSQCRRTVEITASAEYLGRFAGLRRGRWMGALPELPADLKSALLARWSLDTAPVDLPALAKQLGEAAERESRFHQDLAREKLAALRDLAYGASHEINNPLANIATRAQGLMRDERDAERRRGLSVIASQAMRAHTMIADMMLFAKPPVLRCSRITLEDLPPRIVEELGARAAEQQTALHCVPPLLAAPLLAMPPLVAAPATATTSRDASPIIAMADREQLLVALRALVENSLEALGQGGRIEIGVVSIDSQNCGFQVTDNGPGIPVEARSQLFNPYYSGREAGRGLGLGLCKAWRIATDHGGRLTLDERFAPGARFVLELPRTV